MKNKLEKILSNKKLVLLAIVSVVIFLIPTFIWKNYGYFVGGDDSLLHYMYPKDMIEGYANNIAVNNNPSGQMGYKENLHQLPFLYLVLFVNTITGVSNSLYIFLGLLLSFGFLSFYYFISVFFSESSKNSFCEKIVISFLYTFYVHHYLSVLGHKLLVMYIVFLFPLVMALFGESVLRKKPIYLIHAALISSLFSIVLMGVPWLLAYVICSCGIFLYLFFLYPKRFIDYLLRFLFLLFGINFYWIFHFLLSVISSSQSSNSFSGILTKQFSEANVAAILSVTSQNKLSDTMLGLFQTNLQKTFNWSSFEIYKNWHSHFIFINLLVLLFITTSVFIYKRRNKVDFYPFVIFSWLVASYFLTINMFGNLGTRLFLFLNDFIPGFSMFRNNFDKFSSGFAFIFCILLFSVTTIFHNKNGVLFSFLRRGWFFTILLFTLITTMPAVKGKFERDILPTTEETITRIEKLDKNFTEFSEQIKVIKNKSVLWLPINKGSYIFIKDDSSDQHYYVGISPLEYLSGIKDFSGIYSFNRDVTNQILQNIENQDSKKLGELLRKIGITHIAINKKIPADIINSNLFSKEFYEKQSGSFLTEILGKEIIAINDSYSLFEINNDYYQEIFYFDQNCKVTKIDLISRETYKIKYDVSNDLPCTLTFKYPFHKLWYMYEENIEQASMANGDGQNSWLLNKKSGEVIILFKPRIIVKPLIIFSSTIAILCAAYLIFKKNKNV